MRRYAHVFVLIVAVVLTHVDAWAQDARVWLDRMGRAVEDLNYKGTFVHLLGRDAETLLIIHRNEEGIVSERIVSMDGPGREIIRYEDEVQCILPDRQAVLLEERRDVNPLVSVLPSYSEELERYYEFALYREARVANRETQVVGIKPRDDFRYGYLLWLDQETAMPLKSQLKDESGQTVEQILFTHIEFADSIPASALEPTIDTEGFEWIRPRPSQAQSPSEVRWRASSLPGGFNLSAATHRPMAGSEHPVEHLVYSDGLATVSVFIEDPNTNPEVAEGHSRVGSANTYSLSLSGRHVTVVGEVPRQTVQSIATSLTTE